MVSVAGSVAVSPLAGILHRHRHDGPRVHVDPVLGLVRQVRPAVLHLRDLRVRVVRRFPVLVRRLLVLPRPVEPSQLGTRRRLHPRRVRQTPNERFVGFARVPTLDAPHRRVRFQRRRIDPDRLPTHQTRRRHPLENPREDRLVRLHVDQTTRPRQRRVVPATTRSHPGPGMTAGSESQPPATRSRAPKRCPRSSRSTASGNTAQDAGLAAPSAPRRTPRTALRRRRRSRPRPGPDSDARRRDGPRSSADPPSSPRAAPPVVLSVSCPSPWVFSVRESIAPGPGWIPDFRHGLAHV